MAQLIALREKGLTVRQIAFNLNICDSTVKNQLGAAYIRLGQKRRHFKSPYRDRIRLRKEGLYEEER
jgi:DNA-binding NarL/FixJ family response regulator